MKSLLTGVVVILTFSFLLPGTILAQTGLLEGTWELVSIKMTSPDGNVEEFVADDKGRSIKVYNATHFAVVGHNSDGSFGWANAGTYTVEGNTFTEVIINGSNPDWIGYTNRTEFNLQGDVLKSKYFFPDKTISEETWRRVTAR